MKEEIRVASCTTKKKDRKAKEARDPPHHSVLREEMPNAMEKENDQQAPTGTGPSGKPNRPACINFKEGHSLEGRNIGMHSNF